jgi:hypothetical protein
MEVRFNMAKVTIVDVVSQEVIERDETAEETAFRLKIKQDWEEKLKIKEIENIQISSAKAALLAKLGITEEEAKLLLS